MPVDPIFDKLEKFRGTKAHTEDSWTTSKQASQWIPSNRKLAGAYEIYTTSPN